MTTVLIVDDAQTFVREACDLFQQHGWAAEGVTDGDAAIAELEKGRFDGVVLDRNLPGKSGDEVLRWIRQQNHLRNVCVVMLTGYGEVESAVNALKAGAFQYLEKPLERLEELRGVLAAGIAWHKAHALRRELLSSFDRQEILRQSSELLMTALRPDGVHLMFVDKDGSISADGGDPNPSRRKRFVDRIRDGEPIIFEQERAKVEVLEPVRKDARTLMAVPVMGHPGTVIGVLDMESDKEKAFDPCWREVLFYLADLIGIALEIEKRATAEAERMRLETERAQTDLVYREFRHAIATDVQSIAMLSRELLERDLPGDVRRRLLFILDDAESLETALQDLRALAMEGPALRLAPTDVGRVLRDTAAQISPEVSVVLAGEEQKAESYSDARALAYCFKCLIRNAVEAIDESRKQPCDRPPGGPDRIEAKLSADEANIRVEIIDSGIGFDAEEATRLFQPLYSTKTRRGSHEDQEELRGLDRVERLLELLSRRAAAESKAGKAPNLGKGMDIWIHDGDSISLYARQGPTSPGMTFGEFRQSAQATLEVGCSLGGERRLQQDWAGDHGMGLYSVRRIIKQHGGDVQAASKGHCQGATFTVTLPKGA